MIDAAGRIGQIQSTLDSIARPQVAKAAAAPAAATAAAPTPAASTAFTDALTAALSTAAPAAAVPTVTPAPATATAAPVKPLVDDGQTTGGDIVATARKYLGVPYVWGGESLAEGGLDCSGLVQLVFKEYGIDLPRVARQQMNEGQEIPTLAQAQPGDLIVTRGGGHIMIYIGDNQVLHAPRPGEDVQIRDMFETDADITTIRRIVPAQPTGAGGTDLVAAAQAAALAGTNA